MSGTQLAKAGGVLGRRTRPAGRTRGWDRKLKLGLLLLAVLAFCCFAGPLITGHSPTALGGDILVPPSAKHLFGTDQYGRDVFTRVLYAGRVDLLIGAVLVGVAATIGTFVGLVSGWVGGWLDTVIMRVVDIGFAFPFLVLIISIVGLRGPGLGSLLLAVSIVAWIFYARLVRAEVLSIKDANYVRAASLSGFSTPRILGRHLLPNVTAQVLVYASSDFVYAVLLGASVSYLGLGVQPPTPEWGAMVQQGQNFIAVQWWLALFPGLAIVFLGLCFSLIGDGLADVLRTGRR